MITFLTTFKLSVGDDALRQRNALLSWLSLGEEVEVIVFGSSLKSAEWCADLNLVYYALEGWEHTDLQRIDRMFTVAQETGKHDLLAYVNGDIVLGPDFLNALMNIPFKRLLMIGERWDSDLLCEIPSTTVSDVEQFRRMARTQGRSHGPTGMDYFAFRRGTLVSLPPMVAGAVMWDNYMLYHCQKHHIPVIDATKDVLAIHQNHPYMYSPSGLRITLDSPAGRHNQMLAGIPHAPPVILDASHTMQKGEIRSALFSKAHLRHRIEMFPVRHPRWRLLTGACHRLSRLVTLAG